MSACLDLLDFSMSVEY